MDLDAGAKKYVALSHCFRTEAGAYGKALLASDIPANLEIVKNCGVSFTNTDVNDLKTKLQDLLNHPATVQKLGAQAREHVMKEYLWDDVAKQTITLYKALYQKQNYFSSYIAQNTI